MAVRTREELINSVNTILKDNDSDEVLGLIEDITDTFQSDNDMRNRITQLETQYAENDAAWRKKYRDRFNSGTDDPDTGMDNDPNHEEPKRYRYEDLFKEEK